MSPPWGGTGSILAGWGTAPGHTILLLMLMMIRCLINRSVVMLFSAATEFNAGRKPGGCDKEAVMGGRMIVVLLVLLVSFGVPAVAQQESAETLLEQQRALEAETLGSVVRTGVVHPDAVAARGSSGLLFCGVDDVTVSTYSIDPVDNTTVPQFIGFEVWAAGMISAPAAGDGVVYFNDGTQLYRWPANGAPELCCTLTFGGSDTSTVGMAYDPNGGRLLMSKNIATEAIYSLPVVAGSCPGACDLTQEIVYDDTAYDFGGLAYDPGRGLLYGSSDDATPGPAGVYLINGDGTATLVAAYPAGYTDVDGLAFGNGFLFLVTDEPGDFPVYDVDGGAYVTPLTNPWTTAELFSGGAFGDGFVPVGLQSLSVE